MKILVCCDQGNNRSVTIAHHLKYWNHDVLTAGLLTNSSHTIAMLGAWADRIILTDQIQLDALPKPMTFADKFQLWDVGPDIYPRPFNKDLLTKVRKLMTEHEAEYKPKGGQDA